MYINAKSNIKKILNKRENKTILLLVTSLPMDLEDHEYSDKTINDWI